MGGEEVLDHGNTEVGKEKAETHRGDLADEVACGGGRRRRRGKKRRRRGLSKRRKTKNEERGELLTNWSPHTSLGFVFQLPHFFPGPLREK